MKKAIYFDMDGTLGDFYGVAGWLAMLEAFDPTPYAIARPRFNFSALARKLNALQKAGYKIGIVSWLSRSGNPAYNAKVTAVKLWWLKKHLPSVKWDEIKIVSYGMPKQEVVANPEGILFDDEQRNRINWTGQAFDVNNILEILSGLE